MRTGPGSPLDVLLGAYRSNILSLLLLHPDETFYTRQISRLTYTPAGSLHRELKLLTRAGLLTRSTSGNQVRYQARRECPIYDDLASMLRKTVGMADVIRESLAKLSSSITLAFVFGSIARGQERATSDIDVAVVGEASFESLVEALSDAHEQLQREINPVVITERAFRSKFRKGDRFLTRIAREPKIFLIGSQRDLAELAGNRPAD